MKITPDTSVVESNKIAKEASDIARLQVKEAKKTRIFAAFAAIAALISALISLLMLFK